MPENQIDTNLQKNLSVLISGGSGLIGKYLTTSLLKAGYKVTHLSRKENQSGEVRAFIWDPEKKLIDCDAFEGVDFIIHLAGANIGRCTLQYNQGIKFRNAHPCLEMISSFATSTTSIVFPKTLIIPSFLKSDNVLMTLAVLIPM